MAKTVSIKAADLGSGETARFREITFTDGNGKSAHALILATEPADGKGDDPGGTGKTDGEEECAHKTDPDGGGGGGTKGWGDGSESEGGDGPRWPTDENPDGSGGSDGGLTQGYDDHEASDPPNHPGKTGPCW